MKTVVIADIEGVHIYLVDGDLSEFDGLYINEVGNDLEKEAKLNELVFAQQLNEISTKQMAEEVRNGANVIQCGFLL